MAIEAPGSNATRPTVHHDRHDGAARIADEQRAAACRAEWREGDDVGSTEAHRIVAGEKRSTAGRYLRNRDVQQPEIDATEPGCKIARPCEERIPPRFDVGAACSSATAPLAWPSAGASATASAAPADAAGSAAGAAAPRVDKGCSLSRRISTAA